jgi:hypothetical protein
MLEHFNFYFSKRPGFYDGVMAPVRHKASCIALRFRSAEEAF